MRKIQEAASDLKMSFVNQEAKNRRDCLTTGNDQRVRDLSKFAGENDACEIHEEWRVEKPWVMPGVRFIGDEGWASKNGGGVKQVASIAEQHFA